MAELDCCSTIAILAVISGICAYLLSTADTQRLDMFREMNWMIINDTERCEWEDVSPVVERIPMYTSASRDSIFEMYKETGVIQANTISRTSRCLTIGPVSKCPFLSNGPRIWSDISSEPDIVGLVGVHKMPMLKYAQFNTVHANRLLDCGHSRRERFLAEVRRILAADGVFMVASEDCTGLLPAE